MMVMLNRIIADLPPKSRSIIRMRLAGYDGEEIQTALGLTPTQYRLRLSRTKAYVTDKMRLAVHR